MSKDVRESKREIKKAGFAKGKTVYFMYPYGCSTEKEEEICFEDENIDHLTKGKITDIDYSWRRIKVKLIDSISPYGIIIFDGDIEYNGLGDIQRDFDTFVVNTPNRFYMQKGDELWFDLKSEFWETGAQLEKE